MCIIDDEDPEKCATQSEAVNLSNNGEDTADDSHELQRYLYDLISLAEHMTDHNFANLCK